MWDFQPLILLCRSVVALHEGDQLFKHLRLKLGIVKRMLLIRIAFKVKEQVVVNMCGVDIADARMRVLVTYTD